MGYKEIICVLLHTLTYQRLVGFDLMYEKGLTNLIRLLTNLLDRLHEVTIDDATKESPNMGFLGYYSERWGVPK